MATYSGSFTFTPGNISSLMLVCAVGNISGGASAIIDATDQASIDAGMQGLSDFMVSQGASVTTLTGEKVGSDFKVTYSYTYTPDTALPIYFADVEGTDYLILVPSVVPSTCDTCYEKTFNACQATYTIVTGLTPSTAYTVLLTDRNEVRYTQDVVSDGSGNITIDTTEIPSPLFTPESGGFLFEVYTDSTLATKVDVTVGTYTYGCIQLTFDHVTTTTNYL